MTRKCENCGACKALYKKYTLDCGQRGIYYCSYRDRIIPNGDGCDCWRKREARFSRIRKIYE